jgi:hypothetical protein
MKILLLTATVFTCAGLASPLGAQQAAPAKPKPAQTRPASSPAPTVPKESGGPTENRSVAASSVATLAIGELTPVAPSSLPAERVEGELATPADIGRLVEWLAYLGAVLYRAGSPETSAIRELYQQLDAARDETGALLTRAREGDGPPAPEYTKARSNLSRLHERVRTLGRASQ